MFFEKKELEEKEFLMKKSLKLALIKKCSKSTLRTVVSDSGESSVIQIAGIKSVRQEKKGWYYDDPERDTLLIKYLDESWERIDMTVADFIKQTKLNKIEDTIN